MRRRPQQTSQSRQIPWTPQPQALPPSLPLPLLTSSGWQSLGQPRSAQPSARWRSSRCPQNPACSPGLSPAPSRLTGQPRKTALRAAPPAAWRLPLPVVGCLQQRLQPASCSRGMVAMGRGCMVAATWVAGASTGMAMHGRQIWQVHTCQSAACMLTTWCRWLCSLTSLGRLSPRSPKCRPSSGTSSDSSRGSAGWRVRFHMSSRLRRRRRRRRRSSSSPQQTRSSSSSSNLRCRCRLCASDQAPPLGQRRRPPYGRCSGLPACTSPRPRRCQQRRPQHRLRLHCRSDRRRCVCRSRRACLPARPCLPAPQLAAMLPGRQLGDRCSGHRHWSCPR